MSRKLALVLALGLAVAIIAACDRQRQSAAAPLVTPDVGPYGPGAGTGTSVAR